jgi:acyl-CoA thioesterase FadM
MFLREEGHPYDEVRRSGIDFAALELYVHYERPLRFDELVDVRVQVGRVTHATLQVGYLLQVEGETRATAVTVHGATRAGGRVSRLPDWFAALAEDEPHR